MIGKLIDNLIKTNIRQRDEEIHLRNMKMSERTQKEIDNLIKEIDEICQEK
jgi:hypothetical protein